MRQENKQSELKVAVYADSENLKRNGGFGMRYNTLREFACRGGAEPIRLNVYIPYDETRAKDNVSYRDGQERLHAQLRDCGFKVITKEVKWYKGESGEMVSKSNVDLDLAVDAITQSEKLDRIILATGDGDFVQVARALQNRGCRVEVVAFDNISADLKKEADLFMSGYLIPDLLPIRRSEEERRSGNGKKWGQIGGYVRGVCNTFDQERGFGFIRYIKDANSELWRSDYQNELSAYGSAFLHQSELPSSVSVTDLPTRKLVFEFKLSEGQEEGKPKAVFVTSIQART